MREEGSAGGVVGGERHTCNYPNPGLQIGCVCPDLYSQGFVQFLT
jgi:hypothetical protein